MGMSREDMKIFHDAEKKGEYSFGKKIRYSVIGDTTEIHRTEVSNKNITEQSHLPFDCPSIAISRDTVCPTTWSGCKVARGTISVRLTCFSFWKVLRLTSTPDGRSERRGYLVEKCPPNVFESKTTRRAWPVVKCTSETVAFKIYFRSSTAIPPSVLLESTLRGLLVVAWRGLIYIFHCLISLITFEEMTSYVDRYNSNQAEWKLWSGSQEAFGW